MAASPFNPHMYADQYVLLAPIGAGGMADIFVAVPKASPRRSAWIALKKLKSHYAQNPRFISMLTAEAKIGALLSHPNIVTIFDLGTAAGDFFITMEFIYGKSLDQVIQHLQGVCLLPAISMAILHEAAKALDYAHQATDASGRPLRLIHRDATPGNILLSYHGEVLLTDFGIAAASRERPPSEAHAFGKLGYMAPEQIRHQAIDHRCDLYALGCIAYELLCGQRPFHEPNELALQDKILHHAAAKPSSLRPDLPKALDALFAQFLAKNPADRPDSATQLVQALQAHLPRASLEEVGSLLSQQFVKQQAAEEAAYNAALQIAPQLVANFESARQNQPELSSDAKAERTIIIHKKTESSDDLITDTTSVQVMPIKPPTNPPKLKPHSANHNAIIGQIKLESKPVEEVQPVRQPLIELSQSPTVKLADTVKMTFDEVSGAELSLKTPTPMAQQHLAPLPTIKQQPRSSFPSIRTQWLKIIAIGTLCACLSLGLWHFWPKSVPASAAPILKPQLLFYVFAEKPTSNKEERFISRLFAPNNSVSNNLEQISTFFATEYTRHTKKHEWQASLSLYGPLLVDQAAPAQNHWWDRRRIFNYFITQLNQTNYASNYLADAEANPQKLSIFLYLYHQPTDKLSSYPIEYMGFRQPQTAIIFIPMDKDQWESSLVSIIHEVCHLLGARDHFDALGRPYYPAGYVYPLQQPLYPQEFAEIMARSIPVRQDQNQAIINLSQVRIGQHTAAELQWLTTP